MYPWPSYLTTNVLHYKLCLHILLTPLLLCYSCNNKLFQYEKPTVLITFINQLIADIISCTKFVITTQRQEQGTFMDKHRRVSPINPVITIFLSNTTVLVGKHGVVYKLILTVPGKAGEFPSRFVISGSAFLGKMAESESPADEITAKYKEKNQVKVICLGDSAVGKSK